MGLEIVDIENYRLRTEAYKYDSDNNGDLNENEFSIFQPEARNLIGKEGVSEADFNQAIGLYKAKKTVENKAAEGQEEQKLNDAKTMFNAYVDAAKEEKLPLNYDQILKDVKKELKEQNKYNKKEFKELEKYIDNFAQNDANELVWLKIQEQTTETNARKIRNNIEKELKENGLWNKYTEKALRYTSFSQKVSFGKSQGKEYAQDRARANNVAQHTYQTKEEILKVIDQKMFDKLEQNGLIEAVSDGENKGKYNLTALQKVISDVIGTDNVMNTGKNDARSEKHNLRSELSERLGYANDKKISKGDRNDLVRLCGMEVQNGTWKIIKNVLANTIGGAAIGSAVGLGGNKLKPTQYDIDPNIHVEQATKVVVDVKQNVDIQLPEGATLIENGTKVVVNAQQIIDIPGGIYALSKLTDWDAAIGAVAGGLAGLLSSLPSAIASLAEKEVEDNNFKECDFDKYVSFVKRNNPKYAPILEKLAGAFYDKDEKVWHHDKYREFLNLASGDRSGLNRQELIGAIRSLYEAKEKGKAIVNDCGELIIGPKKKPVEPPKQPVQEEVNVNEDCDKFKGEIVNGNKYLWQEIAKGYDCLSEFSPKKSVRILKVIQAIDDNNYDLTRLQQIADLTFRADKGDKNAIQELRNMSGFDYDTFRVWKGGTGMVKLPEKLGDDCTLNRDAIKRGGRVTKGKYNQATRKTDCETCYYLYNGKRYAQTPEGRAQLQKDVGNKKIKYVTTK